MKRVAALLLGVAGLAGAAMVLPLRRLPEAIGSLGALGPVAAAVIGAALLGALVPRTAITVACGALFGPVAGAVVAYATAMLAAAGTFAAGRQLGRDLVAARAGPRLRRLDTWLTRRGTLAVVTVRMLPMTTFGLVGYAYGASAVRVRHYLCGTAIGAAPSSVTYALVGAAVVSPDRLSPVTVAPAVLGLAVTAGAALYWRRERARSGTATGPALAGQADHGGVGM